MSQPIPPAVETVLICEGVHPPPGDTELALSGVPRGTLPTRPRCIEEDRWHLERVLEVPGGVRDLAIWSPLGTEACSALSVESGKNEDVPVFEVVP